MTAASSLPAQQVSLALRGASMTTIERVAGAKLDPGFGFGSTLGLRVMPHLELYGGWDWLHFRADQSFAGFDRDFEETGYTFGLAFDHPFMANGRANYRFEGGGTYKHVEIENGDGALISDSGHGLGFELGAGVAVSLNDAWRISPMLRYRSTTPEFTIGNSKTKADFQYSGLEIGISYRILGKGTSAAIIR
jgi:opacity protein-like surface antigen